MRENENGMDADLLSMALEENGQGDELLAPSAVLVSDEQVELDISDLEEGEGLHVRSHRSEGGNVNDVRVVERALDSKLKLKRGGTRVDERSRGINGGSALTDHLMSEAEVDFGTANTEDDRGGVVREVKIDPRILRKQLNATMADDIFKERAQAVSSEGRQLRRLRAEHVGGDMPKVESWTFSRLKACKEVLEMADLVLRELQQQATRLYARGRPVHFEWLLMVDNSGSMGPQKNPLSEALVVLTEALRRAEHTFAIARFGSRGTEALVKEMDTAFTATVGQAMLDMMSFDEGSYPASALIALARHVWGSRVYVEGVTQRVVVLITDGISQERDANDYGRVMKEFKMELSLLNLANQAALSAVETDFCQQMEKVGAVVSRTLASRRLSGPLADLVHERVKKIVQVVERDTSAGSSGEHIGRRTDDSAVRDVDQNAGGAVIFGEHCMLNKLETWGSEKITQVSFAKALSCGTMSVRSAEEQGGSGCAVEDLWRIGAVALDETVPPAEPQEALQDTLQKHLESLANVRQRLMAEAGGSRDDARATGQHGQAASSSKPPSSATALPLCGLLEETDRVWIQAEERVSGEVTQLLACLEDSAFPHNKWTRRRASLNGATLYLPGLIRAICSSWNYKKIWAQKLAGGRRRYAVALVVDTSPSMQGHLAQCAFDSLVMLATALEQAGIDVVHVIGFGSKVRVLKRGSDPWDAAARFMVMHHLREDALAGAPRTSDAEGLECALDLLALDAVRGPAHIFVLSDGYSSDVRRLTSVLRRARGDSGGPVVQVTALGVGHDRLRVEQQYPRWVRATVPMYVPEALRALFDAPDLPEVSPSGELRSSLGSSSAMASSDTSHAVLTEFTAVFKNLEQEFDKQRTAQLVQGSGPGKVTLDMCFVIDLSGSMQPFLNPLLRDIQHVVQGILPAIEKEISGLEIQIRCAFVGFRDAALETVDFLDMGRPKRQAGSAGNSAAVVGFEGGEKTAQGQTFMEFVMQRQAMGGDDLPEDVGDALCTAANLSWKSNARLLILATDAPGHGDLCGVPGMRDNKPGERGLANRAMAKLRKERVDFFFGSIRQDSSGVTAATSHLQNTLKNAYRDNAIMATSEASKNREMEVIPLFKADAVAATRRHFVFCLDESGSMQGNPWSQLNQAWEVFRRRRQEEQSDDIITIIQFSSSASVTHCRKRAAELPSSFHFRDGGTKFTPALHLCPAAFTGAGSAFQPVLVFMTDGCCDDDPLPAMQALSRAMPKLKAFAVAFGGGANVMQLEALLQAAPSSSPVLTAGNMSELAQAFEAAASETRATEQLAKHVAENLSKSITQRLLLDFL
jgi:uncharacterized protein with von Willebrand factor type A (vWA) domain